ncbi:von Willebrand domain protein [Mycena polygramma]|nr:von Willebrand domain protein [Mycena polygramma]
MAYVGPQSRKTGVYCHEHWSTVGYPLLSSSYVYDVNDVFVEGRLTEVYEAQTNTEREVSYLFEVPPEAAVQGFTATVGATTVTAIVEEKAKADQLYKDAVKLDKSAWKLDQVNSEIFQITLGAIKPNEKITIEITYNHMISSDTLEDSIRLTIPAGLANRPGAGPASQTTAATAVSGRDAVSVKVGIRSGSTKQILGLNCLSHQASTMIGFRNADYKKLTPVQQSRVYDPASAYVEFTSKTFLTKHFVLTWSVPEFDQPRCVVESSSPPTPDRTLAFGLTFVSNITLGPTDSHEYIFLVDSSGSMGGARWQTAKQAVSTMLDSMLKQGAITFNMYFFTTSAASALPNGKSLGHDPNNVKTAKNALEAKSPSGGTDIDNALTAVLNQRNSNTSRTSIIVVTDGLDWGVTKAMGTVSKAANAAAANNGLLRVFVLGLGDDVSRGMCEGLARAGMGATAYIGESQLPDKDNADVKVKTLMASISRAPVRVRSIDWGVTPSAASNQGANSGAFGTSRTPIDSSQFGAAPKGENLAPPPAIQQAPKPGTMFWAIRSYWFAIIRGNPSKLNVTVTYDIPGSGARPQQKVIPITNPPAGTTIHTLAAHALIQTFEDKAASIANDSTATYWNEAEIVRLGKKYSLASSQTSFVATVNGVGTQTKTLQDPAAPMGAQSRLAASPQDTSLNFGSASAPAQESSFAGIQPRSFAMAPQISRMSMASAEPSVGSAGFASGFTSFAVSDVDSVSDDPVARLLAVQNSNGSFAPDDVAAIVFPTTGMAAIPAFISALDGRDAVKELIWAALCAAAFLTQKFSDRQDEWQQAKSQAVGFARTQLHCIFGLAADRIENIISNSMDDAEGYFF